MTTRDPDAPVHLRPYGASVLCIVVWAILAAMALEALFSAGTRGLVVFPGLALVAAVLWALLWAPRVVLLPHGVDVRNIGRSVYLPFAAIERVRLGAMVRFDVVDEQDRARTITAWNAPGIGRDKMLRHADPRAISSRGAQPGEGVRRRLSRGERLESDQKSSRSAIIRDRWQASKQSAESRDHALDATADIPHTRVNGLVIGVLGVLLVACLVNVLI